MVFKFLIILIENFNIIPFNGVFSIFKIYLYLPKKVWMNPCTGQNHWPLAFPWVTLPAKSSGIPQRDTASSPKIKLMNIKFCSVFEFCNKYDISSTWYNNVISNSYCQKRIISIGLTFLTSNVWRALPFKVTPAIPTKPK